MPVLNELWDPNDWEAFVYGLLQDRHGALNIQKVPARHKGDWGLDYYGLPERVVYQCFAVQEPCPVSDRAKSQQRKINEDLKKFCRNQAALLTLFRDVKIFRWVLVVPLHDSAQVNAYLSTKTAEVRTQILPYAASDFEALIQDLDSFGRDSREHRLMQGKSLALTPQSPSLAQIEEWSQGSEQLVTNLATKLSKRVQTTMPDQIDDAVQKAVAWFLERENALELLRDEAPQLHESLSGVISRHTTRLELYGHPLQGEAHRILKAEVERLVADFQKEVPNFTPASAQSMALGTVADWLLRCPLDFPPYAT